MNFPNLLKEHKRHFFIENCSQCVFCEIENEIKRVKYCFEYMKAEMILVNQKWIDWSEIYKIVDKVWNIVFEKSYNQRDILFTMNNLW